MTIEHTRPGGQMDLFPPPSSIGDALVDQGRNRPRNKPPANEASERMQSASVAPLRSRTSTQHVPSILEHGFLTQHQTGHSGGTYNPEYRGNHEARLFPEDAGAEPVYGYMGTPQGERESTSYGDSRFTISSPKVRHNTTITNQDSLGRDPEELDLMELKDAGRASVPKRRNDYSHDYIEAQMHTAPQAQDIGRLDISVDRLLHHQRNLDVAKRTLANAVDTADQRGIDQTTSKVTRTQRLADTERENIGLAVAAGEHHGVKTRLTRTESYYQQSFSDDTDQYGNRTFGGQLADTISSGAHQNVPMEPKEAVKHLGPQFMVHPESGNVHFQMNRVPGLHGKLHPEFPGHPDDEEYDD